MWGWLAAPRGPCALILAAVGLAGRRRSSEGHMPQRRVRLAVTTRVHLPATALHAFCLPCLNKRARKLPQV